ncbi:MAG: T9SS type A sorting domain-containing protein [Cytophagales bacterium]|nr:T9SS type A sorting domain-containing protein [Cytophagales bacterium]
MNDDKSCWLSQISYKICLERENFVYLHFHINYNLLNIMKKIILLSLIAMFFATLVDAQSISSYSIVTTGSVLNSQKGVSLTQPMYQELQTRSSERTIIDELETQGSVKIYPNPFTEMVTVNIVANENGKLKIELYNIIGAKVTQDKTFFYSSITSTREEIQIDLSGLSNGMYFLKTTYTPLNKRSLTGLVEQNETKETLIKLIKQ